MQGLSAFAVLLLVHSSTGMAPQSRKPDGVDLTRTSPSPSPSPTLATTAVSTAAPAVLGGREPVLVPRCRTFFAHGDTAGKDGVEYSTQLLWREHATASDSDSPGGAGTGSTWTLAVNVTATEGARVMLGSAARALPGQPRYEVVLGATANASRMLVHGGGPSPPSPPPSPIALFEEGDLQVWISWTTTTTAIEGDTAARVGALEVSVLPAGAGTSPRLLFSYNTTKPIQVETFSFGSTEQGDVAFTVCTASAASAASAPRPKPTGDDVADASRCRSLLVHVQSSHATVHNLAVGWADTADHRGRLQFWARASTDVEVVAADRLHLRHHDPKYHVVFGGDFNTRTWAMDVQGVGRRIAVDSPALLSDFEFRPFWLSVSHGVLKAGTGNDHNGTRSRTLLSWPHTLGPHTAAPRFISFATYRQRLVHILIDCARPPSVASASSPPFPSDLFDAITRSRSLSSRHSLRLDVERMSFHNGTLIVSGALVQNWRCDEITWDSRWFDRVKKIQLWPSDAEDLMAGRGGGIAAQEPTVVSSRSWRDGEKENKVKIQKIGSIEVNEERAISLNFPMTLKMPCREDDQHTIFCSISIQLNSSSVDCETVVSLEIQHRWKTECSVVTSNESSSWISLNVSSQNHRHAIAYHGENLVSSSYIKGVLNFLCILLISMALIIMLGLSKKMESHRYSQYLKRKFLELTKKLKNLHGKDCEGRQFIIGFEGETAQILECDSENINARIEDNQKSLVGSRATWQAIFQPRCLGVTEVLLLLSLLMSMLNFIILLCGNKDLN